MILPPGGKKYALEMSVSEDDVVDKLRKWSAMAQADPVRLGGTEALVFIGRHLAFVGDQVRYLVMPDGRKLRVTPEDTGPGSGGNFLVPGIVPGGA